MRIQLGIGKCLVMGGWADGPWHLVVGPWHSGSLHLRFGGPGSSSVQPQREQGKSSSQHPQPLAWLSPFPQLLPAILPGESACHRGGTGLLSVLASPVGRTPSSGRLTVVLISLIN